MLNKKQVAEVLGVSVSMVNKLMVQGMPYIKIGRSVRFEKEAVLEWVKNRKG